MSIPISIPRLGWNMEEGVFGGWLKQNGDTVQPGDRLFTLESEKATEEIECLDAGILSIPADAPKPGDRVAVGTVIGCLLSTQEEVVVQRPVQVAEPVASPSVRRLARERGIDLDKVRGSGPGGRISADDLALGGRSPDLPGVLRKPDKSGDLSPRISPRARRLAYRLGIDWKALRGSGSSGRIRERDIRESSGVSPTSPITPIRRTIANRMVESLRITAPVTLTTTVDASNLVNFREQFKASGIAPSYTDLLAKLCAGAIREHPLVPKWLTRV